MNAAPASPYLTAVDPLAWAMFGDVLPARPYVQDTMLGSIVFPSTSIAASNTWEMYASPTRTQLVPRQESPGPAGGAYDVVVDGGRWEAGGPTRAPDGRGEITTGTATGARLVLTLRESHKRWECRSDATWSLLVRWVDLD